MKARIPDATPSVDVRRTDTRPVVIVVAGLELAMTTKEALQLADRLVDAAERASLVIS